MTIDYGFLGPSFQGGPPIVFGPLGLLLPNEATVVAPGPAVTTSPFVVTPNIIAIPPEGSATIQVQALGVARGTPIVAVSNYAGVTVTGTGQAPGPIAFQVHARRSAIGSALISFNTVGAQNGGSTPFPSVPVAIIPMSPNVPLGRSSAQAIQTVKDRTNAQFGEPSDATILRFLNDGLEEVATRLEPIIATASLPIVTPNTNLLAFPQDVERIRDANFSTGNPALGGTVVYEMVQLDYDVFIQETDSTPAGGIGGIPTIYSLIADQGGVQLIQIYPYANTGYINIHYYKRPILWYLQTQGLPPSYTDLDTVFQQAALEWACSMTSESREDDVTAKRYMDLFNYRFNMDNPFNLQLIAKRRVRKRGSNTVRDVSINESVTPIWMR